MRSSSHVKDGPVDWYRNRIGACSPACLFSIGASWVLVDFSLMPVVHAGSLKRRQVWIGCRHLSLTICGEEKAKTALDWACGWKTFTVGSHEAGWQDLWLVQSPSSISAPAWRAALRFLCRSQATAPPRVHAVSNPERMALPVSRRGSEDADSDPAQFRLSGEAVRDS